MSGGGIRSYVQTLGALRALDSPKPEGSTPLLERIRYLSAVSGGSWGSAAYVYYQAPQTDDPHSFPNVADDALRYTFAKAYDFPHIRAPNTWPNDTIRRLDNGGWGARFPGRADGPLKSLGGLSYPSFPAPTAMLWRFADDHVWLKWVQEHILAPANIPPHSVMAANEGHARRLRRWLDVARTSNSKTRSFTHLANDTLPWTFSERPHPIVPGKKLPFLILVGTALGPASVAPAKYGRADFTMMEFNPLYSGFLVSGDREWQTRGQANSSAATKRHLGGAVETTFFGGVVKRNTGVSVDVETGLFHTATMGALAPWRLADAACVSSWGPGSAFFRPSPKFVGEIQAQVGKPVAAKRKLVMFEGTGDRPHAHIEEFVFGDGAASGNLPIINLLQRQVKCMAGFLWQIYGYDIAWWREFVSSGGTAVPKQGQLDYDLTALFGVRLSNYDETCGNDGCSLEHNQVFRTADLVTLIDAWLKLYDEGKYLVHSMKLTTIQNDYLGIKPYEVEVIFSYASVSRRFIAQVESLSYSMMVDENYTWDTQVDFQRDFGIPWERKYGFPFPNGRTIGMTMQEMNSLDIWMLYQNAGNMVLENIDIYSRLGDPAICGP